MAKRRRGLGSSAEEHALYAKAPARWAAGALRKGKKALQRGDCKLAVGYLRRSAQEYENARVEYVHGGKKFGGMSWSKRMTVLRRELQAFETGVISDCVCKRKKR